MQERSMQEQQFLAAYDQYADAIFRHCYFRTNSREVAKDLTQQAFLNAWSYVQKGQVVDQFRAFLYRTAHNLIVDWYRRHKTESLDGLQEEGFDPPDLHPETERQREWKWALANLKKLRKEDQELITWRYVEDMSPGEIAKVLGKKENAVSVRIHRAVERLRKILL